MNLLRWKKGYIWLLFSAVILPILAACGGTAAPGGASTGASTAPATSAPATSAAPSVAVSEAASAAPSESAAASAATGSEAPAASSTLSGKVLRVQMPSKVETADPQKSSFVNEIAMLDLNYEGLTKLDSNLKAVPAAAEKWEFNKTGDEITFTLRSGLKYSDGSPLTSENFRYAIERTCDPNTAGEYQFVLSDNIVGCSDFASAAITDTAAVDAGKKALDAAVRAPDERTLAIKLTNPEPYFPYIAGLWVMYPVKKELVEKGGPDWWKNAANHIGNGPFQMTNFVEDQLIQYTANPNYWEGKPKLDGFEYIIQEDSQVALEAYKAGQLDIMQPDPAQLPAIKGDAALSKELLSYGGANTFAYGFNLTKEPFSDKKIREAFAYAFDRQTYCDAVRNGDCVPVYSWIPKGVAGAIETEAYKFDPAKAKQALAESKYKTADKVPPIELTYSSSDPANQPRAEWVAGQIRDILGITVKLNPMETKAITAARKSKDTYPQMLVGGQNWYQDYPDPQNWLSLYWSCSGFAERVGYCNPKLDEIMKQADQELNPDQRTKLYEQASQILVDDLPSPFLYSIALKFMVKPEVTGYKTTSADGEWPGERGSMLTIDVNR